MADITVEHSVVGSGAGVPGGAGHSISCTVGQPVIGVVSDASDIGEIGFWYHYTMDKADIDTPQGDHPVRFWLGPSRPNPLSSMAEIRFTVPEVSQVVIRLYDVTGREVMEIFNAFAEAGDHLVVLDGSGLSSGVYFCKMVACDFAKTRKCVVLR
jgi:hypothetical protein